MGYRCTRCRRPVEIDYGYAGIRCPFCGHRVVIKERPVLVKRVKAE